MKATFISREKNDVKFTMEFTAEEFESAQIKVYQQAKGQFAIDGFRKGKAPRSIIEKHYGEGVFFEDAINDLISENYGKTLTELGLEVVGAPSADFSEVAKGQGFTVTITVPCFPIVEVKDYKGVEIEKIEQEVKDEDVEREIENLQKRNARIAIVERAAQEGDTVVFDYAGFVGEEQFEGGTAERQELKLGSGMFIPGFEEQLVGVAAGEDKDVVVTFPEEYHAPDLAGKEAVFHCHLHEVKEEQLPELDDEFAKDVSEFDTLDELKADLKAKALERKQKVAEEEVENDLVQQIVDSIKGEIPEAMFENQLNQSVEQFAYRLQSQGLDLQTYLKYTNASIDDFKASFRPQAENQVKFRLALEKIVELEKIEATEEEINEQIEKMAKDYGMEADQIKAAVPTEEIAKDIAVGKAIDFIKENAVITEVEAKTEKAEEKPAKKPAAKKTTKKAEKKLPDIIALADMLRAKVEKKDASAINEKIAIQIKVYGEYENYMYILVDNGVVTVEPYGYLDNDIHIDMPIEDVISVINDKYDFKAKALSGDFYVLGSLTKLLKVKEALF